VQHVSSCCQENLANCSRGCFRLQQYRLLWCLFLMGMLIAFS
jgi:hypothetical protein